MAWTWRLLPILLNASGPQAGEAMLIDRVLQGEEFLDCQRVAAAGFLEREQAPPNGGDHLGLASDNPAFRARRRQVGNRQRTAVRPDDVLRPWSKGLCHE